MSKGKNGAAIVETMKLERRREAVLRRIDATGDCWLWTGTTQRGYGKFTMYLVDGRQVGAVAHRLVYAMLVQELDDDLELDHRCRNTLCVNPDHMEPVLGVVNNARSGSPTAVNARKTHCVRDHEFTEENTRLNKYDQRVCRTCDRDSSRQYRERLRAAA